MSLRIPAVFMRGGTSKALVFHRRDLPADRKDWDAIFLRALGSPDPYGRQLDGMGGGISSLSKVCVVEPSRRDGADIDYTFAQVSVFGQTVDYSGNCGNMSSAIGPFAVDEGLVKAADGACSVRIFNTNTRKLIVSNFQVSNGRASVAGDTRIPGVSGTGAKVQLDFLSPGGATTGRLLHGRPTETISIDGVGAVQWTLVDAANACVFIAAHTVGLIGNELPDAIAARPDVLRSLSSIRAHAGVAMGLFPSIEDAASHPLLPFIGVVAAPMVSQTLDGQTLAAEDMDLSVRMLSNGQPHKALPLTAALCTAVASAIEGTLPFNHAGGRRVDPIRLGTPSGVLEVAAEVRSDGQAWSAERGSFIRTARRLFDGFVYPGVGEERT